MKMLRSTSVDPRRRSNTTTRNLRKQGNAVAVAAEEVLVATGSDHILLQATTVIPSGMAPDSVEQITQWLHPPAINVLDTPETAEQTKGSGTLF